MAGRGGRALRVAMATCMAEMKMGSQSEGVPEWGEKPRGKRERVKRGKREEKERKKRGNDIETT